MIDKYPYCELIWFGNNPIDYAKYAWQQWRENKTSLWVSLREYFFYLKCDVISSNPKTIIVLRLCGFTKIITVWNCNKRTAKKHDERILNNIFTAITSESNLWNKS